MGISFEIHYEENPNGIFFTGQRVKGHATVHVDEPIAFKGIVLRVRGYAKVRWDESTAGSTSDVHFDQEKYFDSETQFINTGGLEQTLNPGTYTYNFECLLPSECPSSFQGLYGRIHYDTKIIVVRPRTFNKSYSMGFSVLKLYDLNQHPELRVPMRMEEIKFFCCGPCKSRPLILSLDIQRSSFVPGEFIEFHTRLVNSSSTKVELIDVVLNLVAFYSVRTRIKTKTEKIPIAIKKFGGFDKDILEFKDSLQVPPSPASCNKLCSIIKISYEVAVFAKVKGAHLNPFVAIPVVIGNIPFFEKASATSEEICILNLMKGTVPIPSPDVEYPPPSYEEAAFLKTLAQIPRGTTNISDELQGHKTSAKFTPRYLFYGGSSNDTEHSKNSDQ